MTTTELVQQVYADYNHPTGVPHLEAIYNRERSPYYRFLYSYAKALSATRENLLYVELGVATGGSMGHFLHGCDGTVKAYGVDLAGAPIAQVKNDPRVTLISGRSTDEKIVSRFPDATIDVLFIDTDHTAETLKRETDLWIQKVADDGVVFFDDIDSPMFTCKSVFDALPYKKVMLPKLHDTGFAAICF